MARRIAFLILALASFAMWAPGKSDAADPQLAGQIAEWASAVASGSNATPESAAIRALIRADREGATGRIVVVATPGGDSRAAILAYFLDAESGAISAASAGFGSAGARRLELDPSQFVESRVSPSALRSEIPGKRRELVDSLAVAWLKRDFAALRALLPEGAAGSPLDSALSLAASGLDVPGLVGGGQEEWVQVCAQDFGARKLSVCFAGVRWSDFRLVSASPDPPSAGTIELARAASPGPQSPGAFFAAFETAWNAGDAKAVSTLLSDHLREQYPERRLKRLLESGKSTGGRVAIGNWSEVAATGPDTVRLKASVNYAKRAASSRTVQVELIRKQDGSYALGSPSLLPLDSQDYEN